MHGGGKDTSRNADLAIVRRFEAAGFRAWPAASVQYDGAWVIRLTAGHPAKRLNSINPLDPGDHHRIDERIARATRRFEAYGRPVTVRLSPLSGPAMETHLSDTGWEKFGESLVMRLQMTDARLADAMDQIPLRDIGRFVDAMLPVHGLDSGLRAGLSEVIGAIEPEKGLFTLEDEGVPVSTAICVRDSDLAGLFEIATRDSMQGRGFGRRAVMSALKWAHMRGASQGWLQVEADNEKARRLYEAIGFEEIYRYHYRRRPEA